MTLPPPPIPQYLSIDISLRYMLNSLVIQNYAIIEDLSMIFGHKLNIITGETGAGKSILTGALGLIQGNRADTKVLYDDSKKCFVEAEFLDESPLIKALFIENDMEFESPIIIRRVIAPNGKSRSFVNDEPVKLSFLKQLSALLLDMHRQFDTLGINDESTQINMIDSLAGQIESVERYHESYLAYRNDLKQLEKLVAEAQQVAKELDFLNFQFKELEEAGFSENEQESLEQEVHMLENADGIISVLNKLTFILESSESPIIDQLSYIRNDLDKMGDSGAELRELQERLNSIIEEVKDINFQSSSLANSVESDPALLEEKQKRLNLLFRLLQKHALPDSAALYDFHRSLSTKIEGLQSFEQNRGKLEKGIAKAEKDLKQKANRIHEARVQIIPQFEKKIKSLLADLGMEHANFKIDITLGEKLRSHGMDEIQFLFSANPGKALQSISEVASGGELSRLALSLKSVVAGKINLGTLIFDEIDTGISGEVSGKMGIILKKLATKHQLVSITHSPQIAAKADTHFFIYKVVENNRTYTKVQPLDEAGRIQEIGKMLSGDPPTEGAIKNAKELMA